MAKNGHSPFGKEALSSIGDDGASLMDKAPRARRMEEADEDESLSMRDRKAIARIRGKFHALYAHPLVSDKTKNEYESMLDGLEARGEIDMIRENIGYLKAMINEAESYREGFKRELEGALKSKWINQASYDKWWARFNDGATLEWHRKEWINEKFPAYLKGWKEAAGEREAALKLAAERGLRMTDVPELAAITDLEGFLKLDFHARKGKAHAARAAIMAHERQKTRFFGLLKKRLSEAASGSSNYLHPSKVGVWLKRTMESADPEAFASDVLEPFLANWEAVRARFDALQARFDAEAPPRGLPRPSPAKFLLWTYDQRVSYIDEADARLDESVREKTEATKERDFLVRSIREDMDSRDWEGAELLLHRAQRLYEGDSELPVIERYLAAHRDDPQKEEEEASPRHQAEEALHDLRSIVPQIHTSVRQLYLLGLSGGSQAFSKVMKVMHARVAHREAGKAADVSTEDETMMAEDMRSRDEDVVVTEVADERDDAREPALYMDSDPDGQKAAFSAIQSKAAAAEAAQSDERSPRLIPAGLPYDMQAQLVDINPSIMRSLRLLERAGMSFTPHGPALSRN